MIHCIKCDTNYFNSLEDGSKTFEVRYNDRDYKVGDYLAINETSTENVTGAEAYTGRCCLFEITYILKDYEAVKEGYVILGIKDVFLRHAGDVEHSILVGVYNA